MNSCFCVCLFVCLGVFFFGYSTKRDINFFLFSLSMGLQLFILFDQKRYKFSLYFLSAWGYSLLFVTLINLCALTGAFVLPCMRLQSYKLVLIFMVALAVGTLVGSGLLFLIPEVCVHLQVLLRQYLNQQSRSNLASIALEIAILYRIFEKCKWYIYAV